MIRAGDGNNTVDGPIGYADIQLGNGNNQVTAGGWGDHVVTGGGNDQVTLTGGGATVATGGGNYSITLGLGGNDQVDGGAGSDTVVYTGTLGQYHIAYNNDGSLTVSGPGGTDTLRNIETLRFADGTAPTVQPVVPVHDALAGTQDGPATLGNVLANDIVAFGHPLYVTGFAIEGVQHAAGTSATLASGASFSVAADGTVTLVQNHAYVSLAAGAKLDLAFSYTVNTAANGSGQSAVGDATIELTGINDAPTAGADNFVTQAEGATSLGNVLANDHDPDSGDLLHVTGFAVEGRSYQAGQAATLASGASLTVAADGTVTLNQNHGYDGLAAGSHASIAFSYTVNDRADGSGLAATGQASIELDALPAGTATTQATASSGATLTGGSGNDTLSASGWQDVIHAGAGDNVILGGNGQATVDAGDGNNHITVYGGSDSITAGNGDNLLTGPAGQAHVMFGDGTESITLAGNGNVVSIGATPHGSVSTIVAGDGQASVTSHEGPGQGAVHLILNGYGNLAQLGDGNDTVEGAQGNSTLHLGNGNAVVVAHGYGNLVTLGTGTSQVHAGDRGDTVIAAGSGTIWLGGWQNTVDASAAGTIEVHGGQGGDLFLVPTAGHGVLQLDDFTLNGDHLQFHGLALGNVSVQAVGADLHILANGVEVVDLVGQAALAQATLVNQGVLVFA